MIEFEIIKKKRKYFAAKTGTKKCKILIDENSDGLEIGAATLAVEDISVKSKYGIDYIYRLVASADEQKDAGLFARYNVFL